MKRFLRFSSIIIIFLVLSMGVSAKTTQTSKPTPDGLTIYSPNYFGEEENVYDLIHYIENEYLSFSFCSNDDPQNIKTEIVCGSNRNELKMFKDTGEDGCYFSNYELENLECSDFTLEINYDIDNKERKITREFTEQKQSKLINHVIGNDYESLNSEEISYFLVVLNDLETQNSVLSAEVYEHLKNLRDNENKCWPSNNCDLTDTTKILRNLQIAGYDLESRLIEDGRNYLEKNMINNDNNPLRFVIDVSDSDFDNSSEIECDLTIDDESTKTYTMDVDYYLIDKDASEKIVFECNETLTEFDFKLYNTNDNIQEFENYEDVSGFTFNIESFACFGEDDCSFEDTVNALITYGDSIEDSANLDNYLNSLIIEFNTEEYIDSDDKIMDSGKYIYYVEDEEIGDYLKFRQNNDGSWGENSKFDRIIQTAWAVMGLQNTLTTDSEYVIDGKKWIYYSEPISGWGSIEKNALAYLAIKEQIKPYIIISAVNEIKGTTTFEIENPTIYKLRDLKMSFSDNINDYVSYSIDLGNLEGEEKTSFNVTLSNGFYGRTTGELSIEGVDGKNAKIDLIKMPINLEGPVPFSILVEKDDISLDDLNVVLRVDNNIPTFEATCTYKNPFNNNQENVIINERTPNIYIKNLEMIEGENSMEINCEFNGVDFVIPINLDVAIAEVSFDIKDAFVSLDSTADFSVELSSAVKDKQVVSVSVDGDLVGIIEPVEVEKIIAANDTRDIFFSIKNPTLFKMLGANSTGNLIITSDGGYVKKIPVYVDNSGQMSGTSNTWIWAIVIIVTVLAILIVVIRFIRMNRQAEEGNNQQQYDDEMFFDDDIDFK